MKAQEAKRIIESLRKGLPPSGYIQHFTVGRKSEISELDNSLKGKGKPVLLLKANYGSGKSHLLRLIREMALSQGYAVSLVTLDAKSGVRFNRMDQIMSEILRQIELPPQYGSNGLSDALGLIENACMYGQAGGLHSEFWKDFSNDTQWDFSEAIDSDGLYVAIRAWIHGNQDTKDLINDWLLEPENYRTQRKQLYEGLVSDLRKHFRDPRPEWQFYKDNVFAMHTDGYKSSWDVLKGMHELFKYSGLGGLVILIDEFEDILTNLNNISHQEAAFWNLFLFFSGKRFSGKSFYAVTPAFTQMCKQRLMAKGKWDFDFERFDKIPTFEMSPLIETELLELSGKIVKTHELAFSHELKRRQVPMIVEVVKHAAQSPIQDRARHAIREVVKFLDQQIEC